MQVDRRGDVPFAFDDLAGLVEAQDVRGGYFAPGELPGVGQIGAIVLLDGDMTGNMVVITLSIQHPAQQRHALVRSQFGQQCIPAWPGNVAGQEVVIKFIVLHSGVLLCSGCDP